MLIEKLIKPSVVFVTSVSVVVEKIDNQQRIEVDTILQQSWWVRIVVALSLVSKKPSSFTWSWWIWRPTAVFFPDDRRITFWSERIVVYSDEFEDDIILFFKIFEGVAVAQYRSRLQAEAQRCWNCICICSVPTLCPSCPSAATMKALRNNCRVACFGR